MEQWQPYWAHWAADSSTQTVRQRDTAGPFSPLLLDCTTSSPCGSHGDDDDDDGDGGDDDDDNSIISTSIKSALTRSKGHGTNPGEVPGRLLAAVLAWAANLAVLS